MKYKNLFNFYKGYQLWKSALENDKEYSAFINSLNLEGSGKFQLDGVVGNKIMDMEWIIKIEEALPYMDKAIRMNRSFIEQKDEIVPVEKVKRVNTQSIRHLAQHTNLIAKVEANGDVLPDRILNIYYESSFAIYENRFLYSLLIRLLDFVEKKYQALVNLDEKVEVVYCIDKTVKRKQKISKMNLQFEYNTHATTKFDANDDSSKLSSFARVIRIRSIIQDFYTTTLIRDLASSNVEPVRSPIINTNLMAKNVNFRNCKELWEYIEMYRGPGFFYEDHKFDGSMPDNIKNYLQDIFVFANFLNEISFNSETQKNLKKSFITEKRKKEKKAREEKQKEMNLLKEQTKKKLLAQAAKKLKGKDAFYSNELKRKERFLTSRIANLKKQKQEIEEKYNRILDAKIASLKKQKQETEEKYQRLKNRIAAKKQKNDEKMQKNAKKTQKNTQILQNVQNDENEALENLNKNYQELQEQIANYNAETGDVEKFSWQEKLEKNLEASGADKLEQADIEQALEQANIE